MKFSIERDSIYIVYLILNTFYCKCLHQARRVGYGLWVKVFNATFDNISIISWRSVLLVVETGVPGENNRPAASH
jgi:hypothetical protein